MRANLAGKWPTAERGHRRDAGPLTITADRAPREPAVAVAAAPAKPPAARRWEAHPIAALVARRLAAGVITLLVVSVVVFLATHVLPGNAAYAVLGKSANPVRLHALERQLHLDRGLAAQYWIWLSGLLTGKLGASLANGQSLWSLVQPRLVNSAVLVFVTGVIGSIAGVALGALAALRKDSLFVQRTSVNTLAVASLPGF